LGYAANAFPGATVSAPATFSPAGVIGQPGTPGVGGTSILFNDHTAVSQVGQGQSYLFTYSLPAGTMSVDGDALEVEFYAWRANVPDSSSSIVALHLNNVGVSISAPLNNYNECKAA